MKKIASFLVVVLCVAFWGNICLAQELTDSQMHSKPMAQAAGPLLAPYQAYGMVYDNGTIEYAKNVVSVHWNSTSQWWEIALNGVNYYYTSFVTVVSSFFDSTAAYDSVNGNLLVRVYSNGKAVKKGFSFRVER